MDIWWQLPGPLKFISSLAQDLRNGKNIVLCLPEYHPNDLLRALRRTYDENQAISWVNISLSDNEIDPVEFLCRYFDLEIHPETFMNANILCEKLGFIKGIIILDGFTQRNWGPWKDFLSDYEHALRSKAKETRTPFIVFIKGDIALDPPHQEVALSIRKWDGVVDLVDMLAYTSHLLPDSNMPSLLRQVALYTVAELAMWDPLLAINLVRQDLNTILNPLEYLTELAVERDWKEINLDVKSASWCFGASAVFEDRIKLHTLALASNGYTDEIKQRLWSAQVKVLLPFVEDRRGEIIQVLSDDLWAPYIAKDKTINDIHGLEISHIYDQTQANKNLDYRLRKLIKVLRDIRNTLAHVEIVSADTLRSSEMLNYAEIIHY